MNIARVLSGGDRRSIGRASEVVALVLQDITRVQEVIDGLTINNSIVRMRCADVAEKVSRKQPDWLKPHSAKLIKIGSSSRQKEVRWHIAQMLPRLKLTGRRRKAAIALLLNYLNDPSAIVKVSSMSALAEFAANDTVLRSQVIPTIKQLVRDGIPAVKSRGRKLLARLDA